MKSISRILGFCAAAFLSMALHANDEAIEIGNRRELFIDIYLIDSLEGAAELRMHHPVRREIALKMIWGEDDYFLGRSLDVFISRLRKYLKPEKSVRLETIRGVGYLFKTS